MEFRLLGPLEVFDGDCALELGGRKRRALLALLLLHANEVVSTDRRIAELWGDEPPQAAATALHGHVSRLRKLLPGEQLVTRSPGYVLQLEPSQLDLHRFESLREEARAARGAGDLAGASAKLREALSLWRGLALADLEYERFAQVEAGRLEELRLATVEERVDVDLGLGRHFRSRRGARAPGGRASPPRRLQGAVDARLVSLRPSGGGAPGVPGRATGAARRARDRAGPAAARPGAGDPPPRRIPPSAGNGRAVPKAAKAAGTRS